MKKLLSLFVTLFALLAVACGGDDVDKPAKKPGYVQDPNAPFYVDFESVTRGSVKVGVTPKDLTMIYLCRVYDKETVNEYTRDEFFAERVLDDVAVEASEHHKSFKDYFPYVRKVSVTEGLEFKSLMYDTDYYVVVFGVAKSEDAEYGYELSTDVVKVPFRTLDIEKSDATYRVEPYVSYNNVSLDVYPSDKEQLWYLCTMKKSEYDYYVEEGGYAMGEIYREFLKQSANSVGAAEIHTGELRIGANGLDEKTTYIYLIAGMEVDTDGILVVTDVFYGEYTTAEAEPSDMYFDIEIRETQQMSVAFSVTRHNPGTVGTYMCLIEPWDGVSTGEEVMNRIVDLWTSPDKPLGTIEAMLVDKDKIEYLSKPRALPAAGQKYYIIAFGYAGGITTDAYFKTFETPEGGSVEDVTFKLEAFNPNQYGFTVKVTSSDPTIYYALGACAVEEYKEAELKEIINEDVDYRLEKSQEWNPYYTMAEVLDQYYSNGDTITTFTGLAPNTKYMAFLYTLDIKTGDVVKCFTFDNVASTTSVGKVSPEIKFEGCFSGDDEAGTIFDRAELTKGKAILVFSYTGIEDAAALYTSIVPGDYSSIATFPDVDIWSGVADSDWKLCDKEKPYTFYAPVEWDTVYTALAYAKDKDGNNGTVARYKVKPEGAIVKNIEILRALMQELYPEEATRGALPASLVVPASL